MWKLNILTPKRTSLAQNTSNKRRAVTIHPTARLVGEPKKRKEGWKKDTRNSGKLAIRPDHPRRRIKINLWTVGGLRCVVIHVNCDPNRARGYGAVGVENGPFLLLWPVALYNSLNYRTSREISLFIILLFLSFNLLMASNTFDINLVVFNHGLYGSTSCCISHWPK